MARCSSDVQNSKCEFPDEFHRIVFMVNEINKARYCKPFVRKNVKLFLSAYFDGIQFRHDLTHGFIDLPQGRNLPSPPLLEPEDKHAEFLERVHSIESNESDWLESEIQKLKDGRTELNDRRKKVGDERNGILEEKKLWENRAAGLTYSSAKWNYKTVLLENDNSNWENAKEWRQEWNDKYNEMQAKGEVLTSDSEEEELKEEVERARQALTENITRMKGEMIILKDEIDKLEAEVKKLEIEVEEDEAKIAKEQVEIEKEEAEIKELVDFHKMVAEIKDEKAKIKMLEARIEKEEALSQKLVAEVEQLEAEFNLLEIRSDRLELGPEDGDAVLTPVQLRRFLILLEELRLGLDEKSIDPSMRYDVLRLFLHLVGIRRDLISRLLHYLYPPRGEFTPEAIPDPQVPVDWDTSDSRYPIENLAFSLIYEVKGKLSSDEYERYVAVWVDVQDQIDECEYGEEESEVTFSNLSELLKPCPDLMKMLSEVPWPHVFASAMNES